jgi:hypothetical protein
VGGSAILFYTMSRAYIPPSRRAEKVEKEGPTQEDLTSALFPTLQAMSPTTSGATWKAIQKRMAKPLLEVVEKGIEREKKEIEDGIRQEKETDPRKMTDAQIAANGWNFVHVPVKIPDYSVEEPEYPWKPMTDWVKAPAFHPDIMNDSVAFLKYAECMDNEGNSIERKKKTVTVKKPIEFWGLVKKA